MNLFGLTAVTVAWSVCFAVWAICKSVSGLAANGYSDLQMAVYDLPRSKERGWALMLAVIAALNVLSSATVDYGWHAALPAALSIPGGTLVLTVARLLVGQRVRLIMWCLAILSLPAGLIAAVSSDGVNGWRNIARYFFS